MFSHNIHETSGTCSLTVKNDTSGTFSHNVHKTSEMFSQWRMTWVGHVLSQWSCYCKNEATLEWECISMTLQKAGIGIYHAMFEHGNGHLKLLLLLLLMMMTGLQKDCSHQLSLTCIIWLKVMHSEYICTTADCNLKLHSTRWHIVKMFSCTGVHIEPTVRSTWRWCQKWWDHALQTGSPDN